MKKLVFISFLVLTAQFAVYAQKQQPKGLSDEGYKHWVKAIARMEDIKQESDYFLILDDFCKVAETDSMYADVYYNLGIIYTKIGEFSKKIIYFENAKRCYERFLALVPSEKSTVLKELARVEIKMEELQKEIKQVELQWQRNFPLRAEGKKVFNSDNMVLKRMMVRQIMANNTSALQYYEKGIKQYKKGNKLIGCGTTLTVCGTTFLALPLSFYLYYSPSDRYRFYNDEKPVYDAFIISGSVFLATGLSTLIPGVVIKKKGKRNIAEAVSMCNENPTTAELKFGFTGDGVGLVLNF